MFLLHLHPPTAHLLTECFHVKCCSLCTVQPSPAVRTGSCDCISQAAPNRLVNKRWTLSFQRNTEQYIAAAAAVGAACWSSLQPPPLCGVPTHFSAHCVWHLTNTGSTCQIMFSRRHGDQWAKHLLLLMWCTGSDWSITSLMPPPPKFCMHVTFVQRHHPPHAAGPSPGCDLFVSVLAHYRKREREKNGTAVFHFECPPLTTCAVLTDGCRSSSSPACEQDCTLLISYINQKQSLVVFKKCAPCR